MCLPDADDTDFNAETIFTVSGWGLNDENGELNEELHHVDVPWVSDAQCRAAYRGIQTAEVTDRMICAGNVQEGDVDSCNGDSGGL